MEQVLRKSVRQGNVRNKIEFAALDDDGILVALVPKWIGAAAVLAAARPGLWQARWIWR